MGQLTTHSYRQLRPKSRGHPRDARTQVLYQIRLYRKYTMVSLPICEQGQLKPCDFGGKHTGQSLMATDGCPNVPGRLFVTDRCTNAIPRRHRKRALRFPRSAVQQRRTRTTYQLSAANGTTINTYGYVNLELNLSLRRAYPWRFVVADVTKPIIGADFLSFTI
ncbi:hypothetical protein EVAR_89300_1 [Eumeta japonica]|uniref:Uncharacterized protein n=1 Tax=Eumeta variegata TaxID=151549 RepID=A0A4C1SPM9_EUMVA|nr:hypothetical protein EVAR_89300_1 [Eumeta japonica]